MGHTFYQAFRETLLVFVLMSVCSVMAHMKGYKVRYWLLAAVPIGLLVMAFLPSAAGQHLTRKRRQQLVERGDRTGLVLSGIGLTVLCGWIAFHPGTASWGDEWGSTPPPGQDVLPTPGFPR